MMPEHFVIFPAEQALIDAGLVLGDTLAAHPETTDAERRSIRLVQDALRRLPEATPGLVGSYGFKVVDDGVESKSPTGVFRSWEVAYSMEGFSDGSIVFFDITTRHPETWMQEPFEDEMSVSIPSGPREPTTDNWTRYYETRGAVWIAAVRDPWAHKTSGNSVTVIIDECL